MTRWSIGATAACIVFLAGATQRADAGAFIFAGEANGLDVITHPIGYTGVGGVITNQVCLNEDSLPTGAGAPTVEQVENSILKTIDTWNKFRPAINNLSLINNDIPGGQIDYESTLLHELGHCLGLAHPNLASESGLLDPQRNGTKSTDGVDNTFNPNAGSDGVHGSADDTRGDDVNLYWHLIGGNDPMTLPVTVDTTTMTRSTAAADLPAGDSWVANADRTVLDDLGYDDTEAVMQQGAFFDEAQRRLTPEDVGQIELGMAGADGLAGSADDYTIELTYGGRVNTDNACDITVRFGPSFAFCSTGGAFINATHVRVTSAEIELGETTNWYYSQAPNTTTTVTDPGFSVGSAATVSVSVSRDSGLMSGNPTGAFEVQLGSDTCSGTLSSGSGTCMLTPSAGGAQTLTAEYLGFEGFDASSDSLEVAVGAATATVAITSDSPDPSAVGQAYAVAVTVTGSGATPTGSVTVDDGDENCNITLAGGSGSCNLTSVTAGGKTLTADYGGDATYGSAQDTESHTVSQATPTVTITSDAPDPSVVGEAYTVAVSVSGGGATPTGSVAVDDGDEGCNITLSGGSGSCALTSTTAGAKTLTAAYGGDANYVSAQDTEAHTVTAGTPTVTITDDSPDPSAVGQAYAVDVTVSGAGATPTGTVTVDDGDDNCNITLVGGTGSCNLTSLTGGAKTLTAAYGGDANYSAAQDTEAHSVSLTAATVSITGDSPDPSVVGQAYTVDVSVSGSGATPTGTVTVDDGAENCNITLSGGSGSCSLTSTTAGAKTLTASYSGDANYAAGQDTESHQVDQATPTVSIDSDSPDPSAVGEAYTVAVTVSGAGAAPTGSVTVDDGSDNCSITLSGGTGSCDLTSTTVGPKTLTAAYGGDANYTSAQDTEAHTVNQGLPTVTINSDSPDPSLVGQAYTVAVTVAAGGATPTGSVTVDDGDANCSITLASGSGSCSLTSTTAGAKTLTASYGGDGNYTAAQDTEAHTVNQATPIVSITSDSPDPSSIGQTYTVAVTVNGDGANPTGSVTVDDGDDNCSITLSAGTGSCDLTSTTAGAKTLTAAYGGDVNYTSAQDTEAHSVSQATPTVTITSDSPDPSLVGQTYSVAVTVSGDGVDPTGSVMVDDGADNCSITLAAGAGSCDLASATAGGKTLTASYAGDANYLAAQDTEAHTVNQATPAVTITSDAPDPSPVGQAYEVVVTVTGDGATPTGSVTIDDGAENCQLTLSGGTGSCNLTSTTVGARTLTAAYDGDANYSPAQDTEPHTVTLAVPTVLITGDSPDPSEVGEAYTVSVTVSGAAGTPTGSVTVDDGAANCVVTLAGGSGACDLTSATAGAQVLTASYDGDGSYAPAQTTEAHTVSRATPTVIITDDSPDPSPVNLAYSVTVTVTSPAGTPTGTVTISDGTDQCETEALAGGSASCVLVSTTTGEKTLTATYAGDGNFESAQGTEPHTVSEPVADEIFSDSFEDL